MLQEEGQPATFRPTKRGKFLIDQIKSVHGCPTDSAAVHLALEKATAMPAHVIAISDKLWGELKAFEHYEIEAMLREGLQMHKSRGEWQDLVNDIKLGEA